MKSPRAGYAKAGLAAWEVLLVVAVLALGVGFLLPGMTICKDKAPRINCVSNIKQIGLAARMWAHDHEERFPWQVTMNAGGTLELVASGGAYRQFLALSNELTSPKVLVCPSDTKRKRAQGYFEDFKNDRNVSYFVGLDARMLLPRNTGSDDPLTTWPAIPEETILSGDWNITGGKLDNTGIMDFAAPEAAAWTRAVHREQGNIGFADGSAMQVSSSRQLQRQLQAHLQRTNSVRFLIPVTP